MGDFLLDFRPASQRLMAQAGASLRFMDYTQEVIFDEPGFGLAITFTENPALWGPYRSPEGMIAAVAGRVALSEQQWLDGETVSGPGGLAGKAIARLYRDGGLAALEQLSGNCILLVYEPRFSVFHIITDCTGVFPAFQLDDPERLVLSSHPDVLAALTGEEANLDEVSLSEFLLTSTVTPPFTFYTRIHALRHATVTTVHLPQQGEGKPTHQTRPYVEFSLQPDASATEESLAEELADALCTAVRRRTLRRFGRTAVALSGGLDSRAVLACIENKDLAIAFCCYDESNRELSTAQDIAGAVGVPFLAWQRDFEYYGRTAEAGVKISGGMGTFANNHFLGIVPRLRSEGAQTLLTGCYFDYLFKGLPLNRQSHWLTGREQLAPFQHQFYFHHRIGRSPRADQIRDRLESRVPPEFRAQDSDSAIFQVEARRTFPLCYEGDNQQRVIPQRVTGWYLPVADRGVLDVYRRIPSRYKLNRSVYTKVVRRLCTGPLARIPDANTGARVGASTATEGMSYNWRALRRKLLRSRHAMATEGSWPDWDYYVGHSSKLEELWNRPNPKATDFFQRTLDRANLRPSTADYLNGDIWLLVSMLSVKLWFEQWHS